MKICYGDFVQQKKEKTMIFFLQTFVLAILLDTLSFMVVAMSAMVAMVAVAMVAVE